LKSNVSYLRVMCYVLRKNQGIGAQPAATHAAMHAPNPVLHARTAAGAPKPAVTPNMAPAAL
jgi:hypothetical protein